MADPVTLSAAGLSAIALSEGVKFLYAEAGEVLKRWWDKRDKASEAASHTPESDDVPLPDVFEESPAQRHVDDAALKILSEDLEATWGRMAPYAAGKPLNPADDALLLEIARFREMLEAISGRTLTFKGEQRKGRATVQSFLELNTLRGRATGVRIDHIEHGEARSVAKVNEIDESGSFTGIDVGTLGARSKQD